MRRLINLTLTSAFLVGSLITAGGAGADSVTGSSLLQFNVHNGVISSTPAAFAGNVLDSFGNVSFSGPCLIKDSNGNTHGTAVFTGILSGGNSDKDAASVMPTLAPRTPESRTDGV